MTKKSFLVKTGLIAVIAMALFVVPANSKLIFGYGNSSAPSAPTCGDQKPGSAPVLLSAVSSGANSITLNWAKANNPVSYYLVTFGTKPGEQLYGNPNVGNTTSYTVNNLSGGKRYYFEVRAGNGCMPGDYSNELSSGATGGLIAGVPGGFESNVLGAQVGPNGQTSPRLPSTGHSPQLGFFQTIWHFISGLFGR
jgi:hypothetical protein